MQEGQFDVVHSEWKTFRKENERGREVMLLRATFEGVLTVCDAQAFTALLTNGLARAKAYGMGMMTVMRDA